MSGQESKRRAYGEINWLEVAQVIGVYVQLPVVLGYSLLSSLVSRNPAKSWKHTLVKAVARHLITKCNIQQFQFISTKSTFEDIYKGWAKKKELPCVVDEIGEGAKLLWIGPKRTEKVLLYCHGGALIVPQQAFVFDFLKYFQDELKAKGIDFSIAALQYSLIPNKVFPGQLKEISAALSHLIASGVQPQNIQFIGDSAGGHLILQLFSHLIHPFEGVLPISLSGRLGGALMMSPWISMQIDPDLIGTHPADSTDTLNFTRLLEWGKNVLADVPESGGPYVDAVRSPEAWFDGLDRVVERVLITAGEKECLKDSIFVVGEKMKRGHPKGVEVIIEKDAVHCEMLIDFIVAGGGKEVGEMINITTSWIAEGFSE